jgi:hypothetical protein
MTLVPRAVSPRTMWLLNERGHITITWSEDQDQRIKETADKLLKQGYSFFVIIPAHFDQPQRQAKITKAEDIGDLRNLVIPDQEVEKLFKAGTVGIISDRPPPETQTTPKTKDPEVIARSRTVAIRPKGGG